MFKWMGYTVVLVKADLINNEGLENFNILCVPGGNMYQYAQDIYWTGLAGCVCQPRSYWSFDRNCGRISNSQEEKEVKY